MNSNFQFKQDRLDLLNSGQGFQDEFEEECSLYSGKEFNRFDYQYKEWVSSVRKGGGQLMKKFQRKVRFFRQNFLVGLSI